MPSLDAVSVPVCWVERWYVWRVNGAGVRMWRGVGRSAVTIGRPIVRRVLTYLIHR